MYPGIGLFRAVRGSFLHLYNDLFALLKPAENLFKHTVKGYERS